MSRLSPAASLAAFCICLFWSVNAKAQYLPENEAPQPEITENDAARDAIRETLKTQSANETNEAAEGGGADAADNSDDPVLDDVLEIIRRRGSVLQGSVLDPANGTESLIIGVPSLAEPDRAISTGDATNSSAVYHVAEQLLRSARLLEALPNPDSNRVGIIREMRNQATRLMIHTLTRESHTPSPVVNRTR